MGQARSKLFSVSARSCGHFTRSRSTCRDIGVLGVPLRSGQVSNVDERTRPTCRSYVVILASYRDNLWSKLGLQVEGFGLAFELLYTCREIMNIVRTEIVAKKSGPYVATNIVRLFQKNRKSGYGHLGCSCVWLVFCSLSEATNLRVPACENRTLSCCFVNTGTVYTVFQGKW